MRTGPSGAFSFANLRAGQYFVSANAPGHVAGAYGKETYYAQSALLDLSGGKSTTGLTIKVWKYGSISGRVIDASGSSLGSRPVDVLVRDPITGALGIRSSFPSKAQGEFTIDLPPGDYVLVAPSGTVSLPDSFRERLQKVQGLSPSQRSLDRLYDLGTPTRLDPSGQVLRMGTYPAGGLIGNSVHLDAGATIDGAEIRMERVAGFSVRGVVTHVGRPVGDLVVRLVNPDWYLWNISPRWISDVARTITDGEGRFELKGVPRGSYVLQFTSFPLSESNRARDWVRFVGTPHGDLTLPRESGINPERPPGTDATIWARRPIAVDADTTLDVIAEQGATVSGRVFFETALENATPRPKPDHIKGLTVGLRAVDDKTEVVGDVPFALVDFAGNFTSVGVPPGRYLVRVPDLAERWYLRAIFVNGSNHIDEPIDVGNAPVTGLRIVFSDRETKIEGRVQADGPLLGAQVILVPADTQRWIANGMSSRTYRITGARQDGSFRMNDLLPGDYILAAVDAATEPVLADSKFLAALAAGGRRITLRGGDALTESVKVIKPK